MKSTICATLVLLGVVGCAAHPGQANSGPSDLQSGSADRSIVMTSSLWTESPADEESLPDEVNGSITLTSQAEIPPYCTIESITLEQNGHKAVLTEDVLNIDVSNEKNWDISFSTSLIQDNHQPVDVLVLLDDHFHHYRWLASRKVSISHVHKIKASE